VVPLDGESLARWVESDADGLLRRTGAVFAEPVRSPPLFAEDLPTFLERMEEAPDDLGWWVWLAVRSEDDAAVGVCGLDGRPGSDGVVAIGYSVYPAFEGLGYATEAARAVLDWALSQPGVVAVRATVPIGHERSAAVARKLGMDQVGRDRVPGVGPVAVFEIRSGAEG